MARLRRLVVKAYLDLGYKNIQGQDEVILFSDPSSRDREIQRVLNDFRASFLTTRGGDRFPKSKDESDIEFESSGAKVLASGIRVQILRTKTGKSVTVYRDSRGRFTRKP